MESNEKTSAKVASIAARVLAHPDSTDDMRSLAASALTQTADKEPDMLYKTGSSAMEILKHNEQSVEIVLAPGDVESAVRQFICTCHPEFAIGWLLNAKYNVGSVVFAGTKV